MVKFKTIIPIVNLMGDFKVRIGLWLNGKLVDKELDTSSSIPTKIVKIMYKVKCGK